jgi:glycosyltransferase involved in cell wall biosynthesis
MEHPVRIHVIIPVYNEEKSIGLVIDDIPRELVDEIVVCNNGSSDRTSAVARGKNVTVLEETKRGYGSACLKGLAYLDTMPIDKKPDIVVFLDGDYSDHPEEMQQLVRPIRQAGYDLVIGSRALGKMDPGAMQPQQIFGNWLATNLIRIFYGYHFTDLGPFRAIRYEALQKLKMCDGDFGWTVEMQVKAAKLGLKCTEVPVSYRRRVGVSKVSGTVRGTILAGHKILWTIFKLL